MNRSVAPLHALPCVGAVIPDDKQRVLTIRRHDNGLWALPTGHVEPGETVTAAVMREVREETGFIVRVERLVGLYSNPASQVLTYPDGHREHFITACFLCRITGGALGLQPGEVVDAGFYPSTELPLPHVEDHVAWIHAALAGGAPVVD